MINSVAPAYKSIIIKKTNGDTLRIDEGMVVKFSVDTGEVKEGLLGTITGKKTNFSFTITPKNETHQEIWKSDQMLPDTLEVVADRPITIVEDEE